MKNEQGMILVMTLLFTFLLTLIVLSGIENSLLENKLSNHFLAQSVAFQAAEAGLVVAESNIRGEPMALPAMKASVYYATEFMSSDLCHKKHYQIHSTGRYQGIQVALSSEYDWLLESGNPSCRREVGGRRVFWGSG